MSPASAERYFSIMRWLKTDGKWEAVVAGSLHIYIDNFPVDLDKVISEFVSRKERRLSVLFWLSFEKNPLNWSVYVVFVEILLKSFLKLRIPCIFSLSSITIYSPWKCVNIPLDHLKSVCFRGLPPPGPPLMFRPAPIRGLKAALKPRALSWESISKLP